MVAGYTYVGRYPPLYYFLVGWPTLISTSLSIVYVMRVVSVLLASGFLSLALAVAWRWGRSPLLVSAVAVAATPMAVYLAGSVNPNGLEIAVAICAWTSALVLALDRSADPPPLLIAATGLCVAVLPLIRGLSFLWDGLLLLVVAMLAGRHKVVALWRQRQVRIWAVATVAAFAIALAWDVIVKALSELDTGNPVPAHTSHIGLAVLVLSQTKDLALQYVGVFGALNVPSPFVTVLAWGAVAAFVVLLGAVFARRRQLAILAVTVALAIVVPAVIDAQGAHAYGLIGQGRYYLPLVVGVVLVAAAIVPSDVLAGRQRRITVCVLSLTGFGQVSAFVWTLHRYSVGTNRPLDPFLRVTGSWSPPLGVPALDIIFLVVMMIFAIWLTAIVPPSFSDRLDRPQR